MMKLHLLSALSNTESVSRYAHLLRRSFISMIIWFIVLISAQLIVWLVVEIVIPAFL